MSATNLSAGATSMTISGTAPSSTTGIKTMYTDGTDLYIYSTSTTWYRFTISGTTITNAQTLTGPDISAVTATAWGDGSNVYMFFSGALRKYSFTLGSATATTNLSVSNVVGIGYASSTSVYLMSRNSAGPASYFYPITKN